jgi:diguanylate cyclase (GGDEF)-like protein
MMKLSDLDTLRRLLEDRGRHLRFNTELEREFQQDYFRRYFLHTQIAGITGLLVFLASGFLDMIWTPEVANSEWLVRFIAGAVMGLPLLLSFRESFKERFGRRLMQPVICLFASSAVAGLVAISQIAPEPYNYYYYNAISVAMVMVFVLSRIQFKWGVVSAIIMMITFNAGLIKFGPTHNRLAIIIINNYVFLGAAAAALIGTFLIERTLRQNYLQSRLLSVENADLEESNLKLQYLSAIDGLTQVANRRSLDRRLDLEWRRAWRKHNPLGFIMVDIDHFKLFNDKYGHQAGDECLRVVASLLNGNARRPGDMTARYGGEEFALVLTDATADQARIVAEVLRRKLMEEIISCGDSVQAGVTASFGVASMVPGEETSPEALILAADNALYRAKQAGRNRVMVYGRPA